PGDPFVLHRADVHGAELAHHVVIADLQPGRLVPVLLVLRHGADGAVGDEAVIGANAGMALDHAMRADLCAGPDLHMRAYHTERTDTDARVQFRGAVDESGRMYPRHGSAFQFTHGAHELGLGGNLTVHESTTGVLADAT